MSPTCMHGPSLLGFLPVQAPTEHEAEFPVLYRMFLLVICFYGSAVYMCQCQSSNSSHSLLSYSWSFTLLSPAESFSKSSLYFPCTFNFFCCIYSLLSICWFVEVPVTQSSLSTFPSAMILSFFFLLLRNLRGHMLHSLFPHPNLTSSSTVYFLYPLIAPLKVTFDLACFWNQMA